MCNIYAHIYTYILFGMCCAMHVVYVPVAGHDV